ncbi:MAG TPA: hypothetical protein VMS08_00740 [Candidatus Saccharimonadia bacterium]|nr:hypothetical protein [Candidatus Saccharimonadia bacterium]
MNVLKSAAGQLRDLWLVFLVAIAVVVVSTIAGSAVNRFRAADADVVASSVVSAKPSVAGSQVLAVKNWGIQVTLPLNQYLPLVNYASTGTGTIGLSAADLMKLGTACQASQNGLGTLIRLPGGTFGKSQSGSSLQMYVATLGGYDYVYQMPQGDCSDSDAAAALVNQETAVLRPGLNTVSLSQK